MPPEGLEPTIPASERPQTYALDRAATGIGFMYCRYAKHDNASEANNQCESSAESLVAMHRNVWCYDPDAI